jgi:hypothetical protein
MGDELDFYNDFEVSGRNHSDIEFFPELDFEHLEEY